MNPGSDEAVKKGCTCPVTDNHYGQGIRIVGKIQFWITDSCPIHGTGGQCKSCGDLDNPYKDKETGESFGV